MISLLPGAKYDAACRRINRCSAMDCLVEARHAKFGRARVVDYMHICTYHLDVEFEWDPDKARANLRKHLVVVFVWRGVSIRVISARRASRRERGQYKD